MPPNTASSWLAGGQLGFNYRTGIWVLGVETDASWTDLKATSTHLQFPLLLQLNSKTDAFGTIAGRVGVAAGQAMFYAKGGGAWANDRFFISGLPGGVFPGPQGVPLQLADDLRWGWMVGEGRIQLSRLRPAPRDAAASAELRLRRLPIRHPPAHRRREGRRQLPFWLGQPGRRKVLTSLR